MTVVFIKPAGGSLERVLLAQLLEPVVQVEVQKRTRGRRTGTNPPQFTTRFSIEKPGVRYFTPTSISSDGHQMYEYDSACASTVDVSAIYGAAQYSNSVVSLGGLIDSFEVDTEEIDRMEDEVNRVVPVVSSSEDEEDEEQTEALQRKRDGARMSRLGSLACDPCNQANILPSGSVRSREPRRGYLDEIRYNEVRGGGSSVDSNRGTIFS